MSKSILIVEDEPLLRHAFVTIFKHADYTVHDSANGQEALDFLHSQSLLPDIVVLDLLMPVMGGLEFLDIFNNEPQFSKIKVLVLSNLSDDKTIHTIREHGSEHFMLKSGVSPRELVDAVKALL